MTIRDPISQLDTVLARISESMLRLTEIEGQLLRDPSVPHGLKARFGDYLLMMDKAESSFQALNEALTRFMTGK